MENAIMSVGAVATDLDDRIAAAFRDGATSDDVAALIREAQAATVVTDECAAQARARALNPLSSAERIAEARRQIGDESFKRERLQTAVKMLAERLDELKRNEEDERRWANYQKAKAERDALAKELADVYPAVARQLANLMSRIRANDQQVQFINQHALPRRAGHLLLAELVARDREGFVENAVVMPRITEKLRLPEFQPDAHRPYAWPITR